MNAWLARQIGESAANIITSLIVLIIVIAAITATIVILRKFNSGTFIVGGKNRTPRLSVRDAAAVDRSRRLVLVRRDNVEHLILIGGPTDVVIETNIIIPETKAPSDNNSVAQPRIVPPTTQNTTETRHIAPDQPTSPRREPNLREPVISGSRISQPQANTVPPLNSAQNLRNEITRPTVDYNTPRVSSDLHLSSPTEPTIDNKSMASRMTQPIPQHQPLRSHQEEIRPTREEPTLNFRDDAITDEIEGRREPSLKVGGNTTNHEQPSSFDEDFDRMFEAELNQAVRNDKI